MEILIAMNCQLPISDCRLKDADRMAEWEFAIADTTSGHDSRLSFATD
jgi:hypothetical protein